MNGAETETACTNRQFWRSLTSKKKIKRAFTYQIVFFISRQNEKYLKKKGLRCTGKNESLYFDQRVGKKICHDSFGGNFASFSVLVMCIYVKISSFYSLTHNSPHRSVFLSEYMNRMGGYVSHFQFTVM